MVNSKFDTEFDNFLSVISHEMKSPIALIKANLELMKLTTDNQFEENLDMIVRELEHLENMSKNLIEILKNKDDKEKLFIMDIVERILDKYIQSHKNIEFNLVCKDEDISMMGSAFAMETLINNLIKNAIEAIYQRGEEDGYVNVYIVQEYDKVSIEVVDNGIGLCVLDREQVFDKFYTTKKQGSGIGLSIVKYILKEYDGYVSLDNNVYGGCTASVVFAK